MPQPVAILGDQAWFPPRGPRWIHPTPDGSHLLIGGLASEVVRMCTATGAIHSRLPTQGRGVMGATLHPDGRRLFFGDFDGRLQALDLETGENLWRVETPHASALKWVRVAPGGRHLLSADRERTVFVWKAETGRRAGPGKELPGYVHGLVAAPKERGIATTFGAPEAPGLLVWDRVTKEALLEVPSGHLGGHGGEEALAFTHQGQRIWVGTASEPRLRAFDLDGDGEAILEVTIEAPPGEEIKNQVQALALSPDGTRLAALTRLEILVLDPETAVVETRWGWHEAGLPEGETLARLLTWSPDGEVLWTRGYSERIWGWPATGGAPVNPYLGHRKGVERIALARDGRELRVATQDSRVHPWDVDTATPGESVAAPPWPEDLAEKSRFVRAPDRAWKARAWTDGVQLFAEHAEPRLLEWPGLTRQAPVCFLPDGRYLVAQAPGGVLVFWNLVTGTSPLVQEEPALAKLEGAGGPLVPSPEGDLLVTRGEGGRVVLLELHRHHPREADETLRVTRTREVPVLATRANLLAFSGDGRRLAVGTWAQREVRVYEVASLLTADLME